MDDREPSEAIRRGDSFQISRGEVGDTTLELAEELCRRFRLTDGHSRLEIEYLEGAYQVAYRHERVPLARLAESYEPPREAAADATSG
jgi:hypothetical protein